MRVLVHLGLNKCASTYIQHALDHMRSEMAAQGTWYPNGADAPCHYGLSKYYGFGPEADGLKTQTVADVVQAAKSNGCQQLILSSEYLSLYRPKAASRLLEDLKLIGCDATFALFSRTLEPWIRSLFNQYVRTVEGGRYLRSIDDFVDQVLANRAIDIAARYKMWAGLVGQDCLVHYRLKGGSPDSAVLSPFSEFSSMDLVPPENTIRNNSVDFNALHRIGQLRGRFRTQTEEVELSRLLSGAQCATAAPPGYMQISAARMARMNAEIGEAYEALPYIELGPSDTEIAVAAA
ncbi:MAG: hypothetical protein AAF557_00920 [Pseudomonadota bacterium]